VSSRRESGLLIAALSLTGLSMRTAVTSVGAVLDDVQGALHASGVVAGVITTLPVICFAGLGVLTPMLTQRLGAHRLLVLALLASTAGLALRPVWTDTASFASLSVLALSGAAISNVLMPSLVKAHFPDRIGAMTALYVTALAVGTTAAAGLTVPIGDAVGGWRFGLASWSMLCGVAVLPWLPTLRGDYATLDAGDPAIPLRALLRSRTAWALTVFFATQSMQAYIAFGWFARFLSDHGISHATAGAMVAVLTAVGVPVSLIAPRVPARRHRRLLAFFGACSAMSYVGLAVAPVRGAWLWMVLAGVGGGMFPVALVLIALRSRSAATTATLSAFVQVIGYVIAGTGPLLFGALFGATGSWALPLTVLFAALAVSLLTAWPSAADRYVDDELATSAR
jgi:CP family cyanate transporter-like MFS transporter